MLPLIASAFFLLGLQVQDQKNQSVPAPPPSSAGTKMGGPSFYNYSLKNIDGKMVQLSKYKGKVVLVVNTASKSEQIVQLKELQAIYKDKAEEGFVVLGIPSNDISNGEPKTNAEIKKMFEKEYEVTFPIFSKISVKGEKMDPLYYYLVRRGPERKEVDQNFTKFLVDRSGKVINRWDASVSPTSSDVKSAIVAALKKKI